MRQLDPDRNRESEAAPASQAERLRQHVGRGGRRPAKIDPPQTVRVLGMLTNDALGRPEQIEGRVQSTDPTILRSAMPPTREGDGHERQ
jgi:hypothetical protein